MVLKDSNFNLEILTYSVSSSNNYFNKVLENMLNHNPRHMPNGG
nr:hypothetical protein [Borreliella bissettiae]